MASGMRPFGGLTTGQDVEMYEEIVTGKLLFPAKFSKPLRTLLRGLLTVVASKRLGNLQRGIFDVIVDRWFQEINYSDLLNRKIKAPYVPNIEADNDAKNFEDFEEVDFKQRRSTKYVKHFKGF